MDDIFTPGIWVVLKPDGTPMESVCAPSGYSARATALRQLNKPWSRMEEEGYRLVRCSPDIADGVMLPRQPTAAALAAIADATGNGYGALHRASRAYAAIIKLAGG